MLRTYFLFVVMLLSAGRQVIAADTLSTPNATTNSEAAKATPEPATSVDLRPQMTKWGLTPRHQGRRNTCSVFATTGVIEFAASKHYDRGTRLSPEYLNWACNEIINNHSQDRGQFFGDLLKGYEKYGVCLQDQMPYERKFDPELKPSKEATDEGDKIRDLDLKVHWIRHWRQTPGLREWNLRDIKATLVKGYPVAAGASHSRIIVGFEDDAKQPGGGIFHVQDSGIGKFTTVTYQFALDNMNDLFWIEAPK